MSEGEEVREGGSEGERVREGESEGERGMLYRKMDRDGERKKRTKGTRKDEIIEKEGEREKREGKLLEKGLCVRDR